jgi:hypothetical protein
MGSPESLYSPEELKRLSKEEVAHVRKELRRLLRASPATRKIIAAHKSHNKRLKAKLRSSLKRLKGKTRTK